jgi:hypothetical protein
MNTTPGPAAMTLTLLAMLAAACTAGGAPRLVIPGGEGSYVAGTSEYYYGPDEPFSLVNAFVLCIDRPGEVTLTDVRFDHNVGDLRVDDFAVAPHGTLRDDHPEDAPQAALSEWGFDSDPPVVTTVCPEELTEEESQRFHPQSYSDIGIEFSKPHEGSARGMTLVLVYESGNRQREVRLGLEVILCGLEDSPDPGDSPPDVCDFWPMERYEAGEGREQAQALVPS